MVLQRISAKTAPLDEWQLFRLILSSFTDFPETFLTVFSPNSVQIEFVLLSEDKKSYERSFLLFVYFPKKFCRNYLPTWLTLTISLIYILLILNIGFIWCYSFYTTLKSQ